MKRYLGMVCKETRDLLILMADLIDAKYVKSRKQLSPLQVQIIFRHLGEP